MAEMSKYRVDFSSMSTPELVDFKKTLDKLIAGRKLSSSSSLSPGPGPGKLMGNNA